MPDSPGSSAKIVIVRSSSGSTSVALAESPPGTIPPVSGQWPVLASHANSSLRWKKGSCPRRPRVFATKIGQARDWNGRLRYFMDEATLFELAGHPHVVDEAGAAMEVVRGEPELVVDEHEGGLRARLPEASFGRSAQRGSLRRTRCARLPHTVERGERRYRRR